jgi:hypothetical protein
MSNINDELLARANAIYEQSKGSPVETIDGKPVGSSVRRIDPDTLAIGGQSYRLEGFNAPETAKFQGGMIIPSQGTGREQAFVDKVATEGGFTNLVTGKKDPYGRRLARQENAIGQSLGDVLTAFGFVNPNIHTSDEALREQSMVSAVSKVFPSLGGSDPIVRAARKELELKITDAGGLPRFTPKLYADDEAQYAAFKNAVGIPAVKRHLEEIERLEALLVKPGVPERVKVDARTKLEEEREALFFAATTQDFAGGVANRRGDRTMMNQAHRQASTAFKASLLDIYAGLGGVLEMAGEGAQWEWLSETGRGIVARNKFEQQELGTTLSSFRDIRTTDPLDMVSDTATYVTNLFAGSLPFMATAFVGLGAGAAATSVGAPMLLAAGVSTIPSTLAYSGMYYADQEDEKKNASLAMSLGFSSAVLERIGLQSLLGQGKNVLTKAGRNEVLEELMRRNGGDLKLAKEQLEQATKKELIDLSKTGAAFGKQQYASSQAMLELGKRSLMGTVGEGGTETLQTLAEQVARGGEWNLDAQYEKDFYTTLMDAAVGGATMGTAFAGAGSAYNMAGWHAATTDLNEYKRLQTEAQAFQAMAMANESMPRSTIEAAQKNKETPSELPRKGINELKGTQGAWNSTKAVLTDPIRLIRQLAHTAIPSVVNSDGTFRTNLAQLKAIMGGYGLLPGDHFEGFKQRMIGSWKGNSGAELATQLGTNEKTAAKLVQNAYVNKWSKGESLDVSDPQNAILERWRKAIDNLKATIDAEADYFGVDASDIFDDDALYTSPSISPSVLNKNRSRLIDAMMRNGASRRDANVAVDNIMSGNPERAIPAKEFMKNHGVFTDPSVADLFDSDIFQNIQHLKEKLADRISESIFLGEDGTVLANLLQKAKAAGEFKNDKEYEDTVREVQDYYNIVTGKFRPLDNYPFIEKVIGWGTTMTMLARLGKAALSSTPEIAISTLGTGGDKVVTQVTQAVREAFREYRADLNKGASYATSILGLEMARKVAHPELKAKIEELQAEFDKLQSEGASERELKAVQDKIETFFRRDLGRDLFEYLGYNDTGYNSQSKFEFDTLGTNSRKAMQVFAAMIGLRALTDGVRMAASYAALDMVHTKVVLLQMIPRSERARAIATGQGLSNAQGQALKELQSAGMDVQAVLDYLDTDPSFDFNSDTLPQEGADRNTVKEEIRRNLMTTIGNIVDSKVVNPRAFNLPKYYYDPRIRPLVAMTRFIAALTSTILPRLYRDYIMEGSPAMRYQAFSVIVMALAFSALASLLKDELSYGEESPYIQGSLKKMQRDIYGSGLLGRFEGVVDAFAPLYPDRKPDPSKDPLGYTYAALRDASPVLSWGDTLVSGIYNTTTGNTERGVRQLVRSAPLVGSFPQIAQSAGEQFANKE